MLIDELRHLSMGPITFSVSCDIRRWFVDPHYCSHCSWQLSRSFTPFRFRLLQRKRSIALAIRPDQPEKQGGTTGKFAEQRFRHIIYQNGNDYKKEGLRFHGSIGWWKRNIQGRDAINNHRKIAGIPIPTFSCSGFLSGRPFQFRGMDLQVESYLDSYWMSVEADGQEHENCRSGLSNRRP